MTRHERIEGGQPVSLPHARRKGRGPNRFTQADISRAIRAARKEKLEIAAIRIETDGTILIVPGTPSPVAALEANPWDA